MGDVFDRLVGQDRAAAALRQHARHPVHAYLLSGPVGAGLHDAALAFAAALECPAHGCGHCEACRRVLEGVDANVTFVERAGLAWRVGEIREAERVGRRRPLGEGYQVVVIEQVELTVTGAAPSGAALLKSLEEPPARTVFVLTAEVVTPALDTLASRCVEVRLHALDAASLETVLTREGATPDEARAAAGAAAGNLVRARVLVRDPDLAARLAVWRSVPERLDGTPATATALVGEIAAALERATAPLARLQDEELAARQADAREMGQRTLANRRDLDAQFKREQRRFRTDDLRFGLSALSAVYRERMVSALEGGALEGRRAPARVGACAAALEAIAETNRRLAQNIDEALVLSDLLLTLSSL